MMTAWPTIVDEHSFPRTFAFAERSSLLAKNLYNAAMFRIRQVFCGWDKTVRTANEREVFDEIGLAQSVCPKLNVRRVLKYNALEKIMRATKNPDFFAGLPMQTAQAVVRRACDDFDNWLKALKAYKKDPDRFLGKPRMPKYCKSDHKTFEVTNQDAVLYRAENDPGTAVLKLPGIHKKDRETMSGLPEGKLKQVTCKPFYGKYVLSFIFEHSEPVIDRNCPEMAGLDFGVDNIAAIACTDSSSVVCKGGVILSANQFFAKKRAAAVSEITRGHEHMYASSKHLDHLSLEHFCQTKDFMHKTSTFIVRWCLAHHVGTLVLGVNKGWKQNADMGVVSNQKFVSVPHAQLRRMITYKALMAGITVVEQEESYTSRADVTCGDPIPVYGKEQGTPVFSGKRTKRGLYTTASGLTINADCNGAANILRKAFPDAWERTDDFSFLAHPDVLTYKRLQERPAV